MGTKLRLLDQKFLLPKGHIPAALDAVMGARAPYETHQPRERKAELEKFSRWGAGQMLAETLRSCWGFDLVFNPAGDASRVGWEWDNATGKEATWMEAVAPFVADRSYLEWDADGQRQRHLFAGGRLLLQSAELVWHTDDPPGSTGRKRELEAWAVLTLLAGARGAYVFPGQPPATLEELDDAERRLIRRLADSHPHLADRYHAEIDLLHPGLVKPPPRKQGGLFPTS